MKNKKTLIMSIIIGILLIVIVILSIVLIKNSNDKNHSSDDTEITSNETTTSDEDAKQTEEEKTTEEKSTGQKAEQEKSNSDYKVEISQASSWESNGKKCATENIMIYNNTQTTVKDWKLDIIYNADVTIDNIWSGDKKISGNVLTITPVDYNTEIPAKGNVNFGYNISIADLTVSDYILYIGGNEYSKADLEAQTQKEEEKTTEEATDKSEIVSSEDGTPVSNHGKLSVKETGIVDKDGKAYQLKGCSTHGITWFPDYINSETLKTLRDEWGANLIRLAMYTDTGDSYGYCSGGDKKEILDLLDTGVNAATELGMYVIVDWHILSDNNPNIHIEDSKEFFKTVSEKYKDYENVIYEICNEPNGGTSWQEVKTYAETIIPIIREYDKDAIIIVGTPTWSQDVDIAAEDPITGYDNIIYAVHFYAATHKQEIRNKVETALEAGLPVFISEFSICDASGNGAIDYDEADKWFELISDKNLSYASWSLSNKEETASLIQSSCDKISGWSDEELSETGQYIKKKISGK